MNSIADGTRVNLSTNHPWNTMEAADQLSGAAQPGWTHYADAFDAYQVSSCTLKLNVVNRSAVDIYIWTYIDPAGSNTKAVDFPGTTATAMTTGIFNSLMMNPRFHMKMIPRLASGASPRHASLKFTATYRNSAGVKTSQIWQIDGSTIGAISGTTAADPASVFHMLWGFFVDTPTGSTPPASGTLDFYLTSYKTVRFLKPSADNMV